jgi:hypothetical protein
MRIAITSATTAALLLLTACSGGNKTPAAVATEESAPVGASEAEKAAVDKIGQDIPALVEMVKNVDTPPNQKDYADGKLADLIEKSENLAVVSAAKNALPNGTLSKVKAVSRELTLKAKAK